MLTNVNPQKLQQHQRYVAVRRCMETNEILISRTTVVARFRPQNKIELASGGEPIVDFQSEDTCRIEVRGTEGSELQNEGSICGDG